HFNQRLNGCRNVEVVQGDLYDAVPGRSFDRIIAHPPYVPALIESQVFRDGGETGESILRRIVEGLPERLRPGGDFYGMTAGWDAQDVRFEDRVRGWLGAAGPEFDMIFALQEVMAPEQVAGWLSDRSTEGGPAVRRQFEQLFSDAGLQRNV